MTYDVILRKKQNKYIARVRDWPEVMIEEDTREAALTQIQQHLAAYLSQAPEVVPIELEPPATTAHPWLQFAGMWEDDPLFEAIFPISVFHSWLRRNDPRFSERLRQATPVIPLVRR
jgi:predicted RNase H-like HicB family nuclease